MLSHVIPWTSAHQTPLSMDFSRQEYRSGISTFLICKLLLENFILPYNLNFYFDNIESQVFISRVPFTPSFKSPFLNNYIQKFSEYQLLYSRHASQFHPILMWVQDLFLKNSNCLSILYSSNDSTIYPAILNQNHECLPTAIFCSSSHNDQQNPEDSTFSMFTDYCLLFTSLLS